VELLLNPHPATGEPSPWLRRWVHLVRPHGRVLDVACGSGRHLGWLAAQGFDLTGVDRDAAALAPLAALGRTIVADIEAGPWPLAGERFDAVVVTNYLWRPLFSTLIDALVDDGGVLLYETFERGHEAFGKPSNPEFLLRPGELFEACATLQIVAYESGLLEAPSRRVQRIAARRGSAYPAPLESTALASSIRP
jgi:SAM-dependent methyltransferase